MNDMFQILANNEKASKEFQFVNCHKVFDDGMEDLREKACIVVKALKAYTWCNHILHCGPQWLGAFLWQRKLYITKRWDNRHNECLCDNLQPKKVPAVQATPCTVYWCVRILYLQIRLWSVDEAWDYARWWVQVLLLFVPSNQCSHHNPSDTTNKLNE